MAYSLLSSKEKSTIFAVITVRLLKPFCFATVSMYNFCEAEFDNAVTFALGYFYLIKNNNS